MRGLSYSDDEVRALVENYEVFRDQRDVSRRGLRYLVVFADLTKALSRLYWDYWEVVLLHGLLGYDQRATGDLLQISQPAVVKRYRRGLEDLAYFMNGGS